MDVTFDLVKNSSVSLSKQLYNCIVHLIETGELAPGDALWSERKLAKMTGLSRGTINKTYNMLKSDNIIFSRTGSYHYIQAHDRNTTPNYKPALVAINDMIFKMDKFNIPVPEIIPLVRQQFIAKIRSRTSVKVAVIECSLTGINIMINDINQKNNTKYVPILLSEIHSYAPDALNEFDLFITTSSHYDDVCKCLPKFTDRIIEAYFILKNESAIEFSSISSGARVGILCNNPHTIKRIIHSLDSLNIHYGSIDSIEPFELSVKDYIKDKDTLIIEPNSSILEGKTKLYLRTFAKNGGTLVHFHRTLDDGSLLYINNIISDVLNKKLNATIGE